ncbi:MAG: magnesium transporter [Candidatus Marinamargulisbacteria bacterium]|jgi:magnesium transporter
MKPSKDQLSLGTRTSLVKRLIESGTVKQYHAFFQRYHDADVAEALEELPSDYQQKFFQKIKPEIAADFLEEMGLPQQAEVLSEIKTELAAQYIEEMEPDDAADLLEELIETDEAKAESIIDALSKEEAEDIKGLLSYAEDSAGAIMTSEFLSIPEELTVKQALAHFKNQDPPDSEISFYIFVINDDNRLIGHTTLRTLVMSKETSKVKDIRYDNTIKTTVDDDQEEAARLIQKYDLLALPVVDHQNRLVGLITVDDIVDVVVEEATEDLYKLSGTSEFNEEKLLSGNIGYALRSRLPWLFITILGGLLASYIITLYSQNYPAGTLVSLSLFLSFIPLLMGLGGNVGNQSATIIVRGLSTGHIKDKTPFTYIFRETLVGCSIGILVGAIVFSVNFFLQPSTLFSVIISVSIFANITIAAFIGSSLPIILKKCRVDPAVASAPFISTALDIIGQLIYFAVTFFLLTSFLA